MKIVEYQKTKSRKSKKGERYRIIELEVMKLETSHAHHKTSKR